jgi:DNA-binding sugar fermentation-stimulating protein
VWIGAHPSLGNSLASEVIKRRLLPKLPKFIGDAASEVPIHGGKSRIDFMLPGDIPVEVKNIVCADYREENLPKHLTKSYIGRKLGQTKDFSRSGIFPTGKPN